MRRLLDADGNFHHDTRWRSGCGLRRVGMKYGPERTERACGMALRYGGRSYKHVQRILKNARDQLEVEQAPHEDPQYVEHGQVRGADYYQ